MVSISLLSTSLASHPSSRPSRPSRAHLSPLISPLPRPSSQSLSIKSIKSLAPLLDRVLIQRAKVVEVRPSPPLLLARRGLPRLTAHLFPSEQKTASGLYLPSAASQGPPPEGTVLAVGPGAPRKDGSLHPVSLKEGDRVVLPAFGGVPVKVGDEVRSRSPRSTSEAMSERRRTSSGARPSLWAGRSSLEHC